MGVLWNSNSSKTRVSSAVTDDAAPAPQPPEPRRYGWFVLGLGVLAVLVVLWFVMAQEVRSSKLQAREFSRFAASLSYSMHEGPSNAMLYPGAGPFDKRLGYSALGDFLARLQKRDYVITQQSRFSPALLSYSEKGFFVPYSEKIQTGLSITDCAGSSLYQYKYPQQLYPSFASIPPLVVHSLLFIENRNLLNPDEPQANPAVDWPRFAMAAYSQAAKLLHLPGQSAG
ncbi:MAG: transglycosylase domain-containing protein, partial [Pseudomonas sp.]|nr:transglycosylase domain-containing protein [Pseudomonas sp.]